MRKPAEAIDAARRMPTIGPTPKWQPVSARVRTLFVRNRSVRNKNGRFPLFCIRAKAMIAFAQSQNASTKGIAMKVIAYARVSTQEQAKSGVSLPAQAEKLAAYAALYSLEIVELIQDAGESAKSLRRPGLQRALAMLKRGEADGLLIYKLDRLSRKLRDWNALIDGFFGEKSGKALFSVTDSINTKSASGRMVLNVMMTIAQWELETIIERTCEGMDYKRSKGERISRHIPFGFRLSEDGVALIKDAAEQAILSEIVQLRQAGHTLRAIADALNSRSIPAKNGKRWAHTSIRSILTRNAA
jgi:site-specific DNA recombinase